LEFRARERAKVTKRWTKRKEEETTTTTNDDSSRWGKAIPGRGAIHIEGEGRKWEMGKRRDPVVYEKRDQHNSPTVGLLPSFPSFFHFFTFAGSRPRPPSCLPLFCPFSHPSQSHPPNPIHFLPSKQTHNNLTMGDGGGEPMEKPEKAEKMGKSSR
jgi:hypothetical protein